MASPLPAGGRWLAGVRFAVGWSAVRCGALLAHAVTGCDVIDTDATPNVPVSAVSLPVDMSLAYLHLHVPLPPLTVGLRRLPNGLRHPTPRYPSREA